MAMRFMSADGRADRIAVHHFRNEERRSIFLRDGDVIPSVVTKIDENGVWFRSSLSASTFVANEKVKAVELAPEPPNNVPPVRLTRSKVDRLLMLPRMQKNDPPTHLIRAKSGDYVRGRVVGMDDQEARRSRFAPRTRTSPATGFRESSGCTPTSSTRARSRSLPGAASRVQALRNDGVRLTFHAEKFTGNVLSGKSDVLGPCQVAVKQIDQLLIGDAIEKAAAQLPYQQWKLANAPDPKYVTAGEGGDGGDSGVESPLVGKPAPEIDLAWSAGKDSSSRPARATWSFSTSGRPGAAPAFRRCLRSSVRPASSPTRA